LTGKAAPSEDDIIKELTNDPAGTFDQGGPGMGKANTGRDLNTVLNPLGYQATRTQVDDSEDFVTLVGQGNVMAIGTTLEGKPHIVAVAPVGPNFQTVNVYNDGPATSNGNGSVSNMSAYQASSIPQPQAPDGASGWIWVITKIK
jgi:hypothetical protein